MALPPGGFLQATADGEAALVAAAREWLAGSATVADLFAGLGTFAFALAAGGTKVLAVEGGARCASGLQDRGGPRAGGRSTRCTATCSAIRCSPTS